MATIYKIYCRDIEITDCYIGSTEDYDRRCGDHKSNCYNTNGPKYNYKLYKYIRANGGFDNFIIQEIIDCDLEDRYYCELYYFKLFNATLNTKFPKRSRKEYYNDNREHIIQYLKQYRENNKQELSEKKKLYRIENKEKISEQKKQNYNDNKQQLLEKNKIYRENNKQQISEQKKQKHHCECGTAYTQSHKARHIKSTKHQNYINSKL